jgi:polyisoprenoid-binding protein YceI
MKLLTRHCLAALLLLIAGAARAQTVDLSRSQISFGFKQENVPGEGRFRKFSAQIAFDAAKPEATRANIEVDVTSVDLGDANWNNDIQSASWFNTAQFPKSTFVISAGAKALSGGRFEAPGKFTLKGVTRDVTASFTARPDAGGTLLEGSVPVRRNDYKMGEGPWSDVSVVADEVAVRFKVYLKK